MKPHDDDHAIIEAGYTPQLKRSLGPFASFAIPFSEMSITTGIFANFGFVLLKAGPFGLWTWWLVARGHTMVALVFAEMAGRIPLAGSLYNWNNKLANPTVGWFTGWLAMIAFAIGTAGVTMTLLPIIGVIMGYDLGTHLSMIIAVLLILAQLTINLYGARITSQINIIAVIAEIISMVGLAVLVLFAAIHKGQIHFDLLTKVPSSPKPYWPGFLMSSLMCAWTILGFECSADVSEETVNTQHVTPRGMVSAVLISAVVGFAFVFIMAIAIPDVKEVTNAAYPLAAITSYYLGDAGTHLFLAFVLTSVFACAMVVMMTGARFMFAMARDRRMFASSFFGKVSAHRVPKNASIFIAGLAIIFVLIGDNLTLLSGAATVCVVLYYLITVISFGFAAPKLPDTHTFSLGRWHWPVVIIAAAWLIVEIGILTLPEEFHAGALTALGVIVSGIVMYFLVGRPKKSRSKGRSKA